MEVKSLLQSKTFWVAAVQAMLGIVVIFATQYPAVGELVIAKSILDVFLRILTDQPVAIK